MRCACNWNNLSASAPRGSRDAPRERSLIVDNGASTARAMSVSVSPLAVSEESRFCQSMVPDSTAYRFAVQVFYSALRYGLPFQ